MIKRRIVIFIACWFFALGIVVASFLPRQLMLFALYYFIASVFFSVLAAWQWRKKNIRAVLIWTVFLFLGLWRFAVSLPVETEARIWHYNGEKVELIGLVSAEPVNKGRSQKLEIKSLAIKSLLLKEESEVVGGKVLVIASAYPRYNYDDILKMTCALKRPDKLEGFDYEKYLAAEGFYSTCSFPKIAALKEKDLPPPILSQEKNLSRFNWLWGEIYKVREKLSATIDDGLAEPEAGLLKAFILNDPTVPDDLNVYFRQSGLSHIVAISGSHISLIIAIIFFCLLFFGLNRRHAFWFCVPIIIFYVAMVGAPASATRAGIMGFLVLLAMYLGRLSRLDYILVLSGAAMLLFNPMLVIADAGFQLSFLAVLGMIYLYPIFDKLLAKFYKDRNKIVKIICQTSALTIAAQVFTAPILIFGFQQISLVAPLANLLVLWAAPFIMIAAFIAMGLSLTIPAGAAFFFLPAGFLVKYLIFIAEISSKLPLAYWKF